MHGMSQNFTRGADLRAQDLRQATTEKKPSKSETRAKVKLHVPFGKSIPESGMESRPPKTPLPRNVVKAQVGHHPALYQSCLRFSVRGRVDCEHNLFLHNSFGSSFCRVQKKSCKKLASYSGAPGRAKQKLLGHGGAGGRAKKTLLVPNLCAPLWGADGVTAFVL